MAPPPLRRKVASRLRGFADRLDPRRSPARPPVAPLVRFNGRWWRREDLAAIPPDEGSDVQLLP
jgi:hypothetical protein